MYPYCEVLYKTEDSIGWDLAIFNGDKEIVKEKCQSHNWFEYRIFDGSSYYREIKDKLKYCPDPYVVHTHSYWVYSHELDKWLIDDEEISPYPQKKCRKINDIEFKYTFDETDENWNDPEDFEDEEEDEIYISADVRIKANKKEIVEIVEVNNFYIDDIEKFINKLRNNKFAIFHINEFTSDKYIAWEKDGKIRFMVCDYSTSSDREYIPIILDVLIDKEIFFNKFENFYFNIKKESSKFKEEFIEAVRKKEFWKQII